MTALEASAEPTWFRHEAFLYDGDTAFVEGVGAFLRAGLDAQAPMLVVVSADKIGWLRDHLGRDSDDIRFADMATVGRNPGRIISYWRDFVEESAGDDVAARGVGEPVFPGRTPAELNECSQHEALLNTAFDDGSPWWLLCPYDTATLDPALLEEAFRNHPEVVCDGAHRPSEAYLENRILDMIDEPLPEPASTLFELRIAVEALSALRGAVRRVALDVGLEPRRAADLVLAVNELAGNSVRHAGGDGTLRCWTEDGNLVCEVRDRGRIDDPLVGRTTPTKSQPGGRGVWMVHQLCDLVQLRTSAEGTVVRVHAHLG